MWTSSSKGNDLLLDAFYLVAGGHVNDGSRNCVVEDQVAISPRPVGSG